MPTIGKQDALVAEADEAGTGIFLLRQQSKRTVQILGVIPVCLAAAARHAHQAARGDDPEHHGQTERAFRRIDAMAGEHQTPAEFDEALFGKERRKHRQQRENAEHQARARGAQDELGDQRKNDDRQGLGTR